MIELALVGIGGFIGACCRYLITLFFLKVIPAFPFGTLCANVVAGLLIGLLVGMNLDVKSRLFLVTGLLGGLSTFSAFSLETVNMLNEARYLAAAANILLNVGVSLACVFLGMWIVKEFIRC
ncbi:MAG: fluoride efflux transporter CrcB [Deferribacteraceae bacterium]|jgi:CrcB protein|nr:fluoride efflux transporter CrcB [Deferribacteraceae bacterium]